jgi:hypothetical protein
MVIVCPSPESRIHDFHLLKYLFFFLQVSQFCPKGHILVLNGIRVKEENGELRRVWDQKWKAPVARWRRTTLSQVLIVWMFLKTGILTNPLLAYFTNIIYIKIRHISYPRSPLLLDSAPNLGPLISRWEINKFENCWYKIVRILEVLKLLFQQIFLICQVPNDEVWVVQY